MQDPHFDSDPTSVSKAALASNDKPTNSDYVNQVPWLLIVPGTPSGCSIMLWPHTPPGVTSHSVAIHIKFGEALAFRADVAHAGTFQQLLAPLLMIEIKDVFMQKLFNMAEDLPPHREKTTTKTLTARVC